VKFFLFPPFSSFPSPSIFFSRALRSDDPVIYGAKGYAMQFGFFTMGLRPIFLFFFFNGKGVTDLEYTAKREYPARSNRIFALFSTPLCRVRDLFFSFFFFVRNFTKKIFPADLFLSLRSLYVGGVHSFILVSSILRISLIGSRITTGGRLRIVDYATKITGVLTGIPLLLLIVVFWLFFSLLIFMTLWQKRLLDLVLSFRIFVS